MASYGRTVASVVASAALAGVTLAVFAVSQLRGPEGTVHKFIRAVERRDGPAVDRLMFGTAEEKIQATALVDGVLKMGGRYAVLDVNHDSDRARVGVLLVFPNGAELPWIVSLRRVSREWLIDARQSSKPGPAFL